MAALQQRNGSYRLIFHFDGKQQSLPIGKVPLSEARQWKGKTEHLLMRVKQRLLEVPPECTINDFLLHDGKPPTLPSLTKPRSTTLDELRKAYLKVFSNGAIESNTLATVTIHLAHIEETLGKAFPLPALTLAKLQEHISRRVKLVAPVTAKKEIDSFRAVWNWGRRNDLVNGLFPSAGLVYPKSSEVLPYMRWEEIERRIKAGGDPDSLWDCLYLDATEVAEFLTFAKAANVRDYLYPMLVMAGHTGARRSEMMRARLEDVDLANAVITLREKKRARGTYTTRRVPISKLLGEVLSAQMKSQEGKVFLFGDGEVELTDGQVHKGFAKLVKGSKWDVLRGFHVLRHAFISALASKSVDQRIIDEFVGHRTEEQRRRYRHLQPQVTRDAIAGVFGYQQTSLMLCSDIRRFARGEDEFAGCTADLRKSCLDRLRRHHVLKLGYRIGFIEDEKVPPEILYDLIDANSLIAVGDTLSLRRQTRTFQIRCETNAAPLAKHLRQLRVLEGLVGHDMTRKGIAQRIELFQEEADSATPVGLSPQTQEKKKGSRLIDFLENLE